jgi:hypothetical protein
MVYGLYMLAGTGWAVLVGGFVLYTTGHDMMRRREAAVMDARAVEAGATAAEHFVTKVNEMQDRQRRARHN